MSTWALIQASEDGRPITWLDDNELDTFLHNPVGSGIRRWLPSVDAADADPNYWPTGAALLVRVEVVVPEPVTTAWQIPGGVR